MALLLCGGTAVHSLTRVVTWWCRLHGIPRRPSSRHPPTLTWIDMDTHSDMDFRIPTHCASK